jgi:hypothetical protein
VPLGKHSIAISSASRGTVAFGRIGPVPQPPPVAADNPIVWWRTRARSRARADARAGGDAGASLVEFALILPLFMMLLLGMFTGGLAYSRKLAVGQATREGARYGATLPLSAEPTVDLWLQRVADVAVSSSDSELSSTVPGMQVCVAYVPGSGTPRRLQRTGASTFFSDSLCFTDGRAGEARVQVLAGRSSTLEALVWSRDLDLRTHAVARFEAG